MASLVRPFLVLSIIAFVSNPTAALRKLQLLVQTILYLTLCSEKKWKPTPDPAKYFPSPQSSSDQSTSSTTTIETKTIIFVRHGESTWNDTFNKGDRKVFQFVQGFIPGLFQALWTEYYFAVTGQANDSWFYDAPLSHKGRHQAEGIRTYLQQSTEFMLPKEQEYVAILKGALVVDNKPKEGEGGSKEETKGPVVNSYLVSSPLRRAVSTVYGIHVWCGVVWSSHVVELSFSWLYQELFRYSHRVLSLCLHAYMCIYI
jgi:hypothetical protein